MLAVALAVWGGENLGIGPFNWTAGQDRLSSMCQAPPGTFVTDYFRGEADDISGRRLDAYERKEMGLPADDGTWGGLLPPGGW